MKRMILGMSVVAAMLLTASSAMAAGLNLRWQNCLGDAGTADRTSACASNLGNAGTLVGSFVIDNDIIGVTGVECVLDVLAAGGTLPQWWEYNAPGGTVGCRGTAMTANAAISGSAVNCFDWAGGAAAGGLAAYRSTDDQSIDPASRPAHKRIIIGFAVAAPTDVVAGPGAEYFAFNTVITNAKTTGAGNCLGCATPVCIVFNSINIVPGTAAGTVIGAGTAAGTNFATFNGGAGANCLLVPTKNTTWGQVKSLYR
ncbi:MAG: hypothetical protein ABL977_12385 [Candidatus Eisenbacteria bacterium]